MQITTRILASLTRQTRWSEGHIFSVTPEQIGIVEGLRASLAIAVMLAADLQWQIPDLAFGAVAAFWTCLCDPGGSNRARLRVMVTFAIGATLAISLAAFFAHMGKIAGGIALFVLILICGLTRSYRPSFGPMPSPVGLIVAIAVVVGVTAPRSIGGTMELAGCFLSGCVWAVVLCIYIWRTNPSAPARRSLIAIFVRLEAMTVDLQHLDLTASNDADQWSGFNVDHRRAVRFSIERGRETVAKLSTGRNQFSHGIDAASRVFAALMALGHNRADSPHPFDPDMDRPVLDSLRQLLQEAVLQYDKASPAPETLLIHGNSLVCKAAESQGAVARAVGVAAAALVDLGHHWQHPEVDEHDAEVAVAVAKFKILAPVWRQAFRTAVATAISYAIGAWYDVSFSYWGTIATLVLMQPLGANTWLRIVERAAGSIIGGVLTAVLIARLSGPWEILLFIAPLSAAVIALRLVNYGLFMVFVTPMFVLVSDFIHPASNLVATRAINEAMGACIGLAGTLFFWPEKEKNALLDAILAAISANLAFAAGVLRLSPIESTNMDQLRREAGIASSRAEIAQQRMVLQGRSRAARLDRVREVLVALRTICGAANTLVIARQFEPDSEKVARANRYDELARILRAAIGGGSAERAALASFEVDGSDILDRAVHSLLIAVQDYLVDCHPNDAGHT